jgi:vacuolar-type H+-ATPase subunit H
VSTEGPAQRREIEDATAARLAEIVAAAERAAKQVIDEAEAEARARLAAAEEEADRVVAERLAVLTALTDEVDAQAAALGSQAEALREALARVKAELRGDAQRPSAPALTVVGEAPAPPASDRSEPSGPASAARESPVPDPQTVGAAAGARLLATQMAVSGSSRAEIEERLRDGFELADTGAILDAILGPDQ